jgi:hypothetical protein
MDIVAKNVRLKNRSGEYLEPYTENIPTASTSTAGKVQLDSSPTSGSNNAITSGAVHTALGNMQTSITALNTALSSKVNNSALQVVDSKPASPDSSTFYFVKE